jgi:flagellum-specific ATP synthase
VVEQTSPGVDERLLGRVVDGLGRPLDGRPPITSSSGDGQRIEINPLTRKLISEPLETGVRAVDSLLTIGRGQRVGIFAGSGVGKSVLLGMLAGRVAADVVVVGLIGERGREVREFCDDILGPKGLQRSVVVAAPADAAPLARLRGAFYATRVAQYFRDTGRHTVLILDSLSRFGMAQREIALSTGEPPATKGYPPSVFAKIPELVEMAGNSSNEEGSLTSFYTVLLEGDDTNDPVADTARAILDGHIFLSRDLSEMGHYPAIDVERSISRAMPRASRSSTTGPTLRRPSGNMTTGSPPSTACSELRSAARSACSRSTGNEPTYEASRPAHDDFQMLFFTMKRNSRGKATPTTRKST